MTSTRLRGHGVRSGCAVRIDIAEPRLLLADFATLDGDRLRIDGTGLADRMRIEARDQALSVSMNGRTRTFAEWRVNQISIQLNRGNDRLENTTAIPSAIYGDGGDDTIVAGNGNDSVYAGSGNDRIYGCGGNDSIDAYFGDDFIAPGAGRDTVQAGSGVDELSYGDRKTGVDFAFEYRLVNTSPTGSSIVSECHLDVGSETDQSNDVEAVTGSTGDDTLSMVGSRAAPGVDPSDPTAIERVYRINGGKGNDVMFISQSVSSLPEVEVTTRQVADGGEGDDTLNATARGETTLLGGNGDDQFSSTDTKAFAPYIDAGEGIDSFYFAAARNLYHTMSSSLENFTLNSTTDGPLQILANALSNRIVIERAVGAIYIDARYGDDYVDARAAFSEPVPQTTVEIRGGLGDDTLLGTRANDLIFGGGGEDYLFGSDGVDTLKGDTHDDALDGGAGADLIYGGGGHDRAKSDPGDALVESIETLL